ncbi:hypothetical protein ZOSMA_193G00070 [Zostera marina]|nr:hypothetical protein ZOSMA_193G00070 [Zostera marina]
MASIFLSAPVSKDISDFNRSSWRPFLPNSHSLSGASMLCVGGSGRAKNQNAGRLSTNAVATKVDASESSTDSKPG